VSGVAAAREGDERILVFEVGASVYALPIASVLEVAEAGDMACIPMLAPRTAGVMNHHGDALPVFRCASLLDLDAGECAQSGHVLVIARPATNVPCLGLPVDRIHGLVDGGGATARGAVPVAERRPIDGRVVHVLDPQRLVAKAEEVIHDSLGRAE
jgi:chemotaxis signal transduction protein